MRATAIMTFTCLIALAAVGCSGGGRQTEQGFGLDTAPSAGSADGLQVQILHFKQRENYLIVNVRITNNSRDTLVLKNPGSTLIGFSANAEGRQVSAEKRAGHAYWSPWTGTVVQNGGGNQDNLELPAGITTEMELRWNWRPELSKKDYDWVVTVGQIYKGEAKQPDLKISFPPAQAAAGAAAAPAK